MGVDVKANYYNMLEVSMGADEDEIRRAYDRIKQIYSDDSLATYGLYTPEEIKEFRENIEHVFRILIDSENRRDYDKSLISEPVKKKKQIKLSVKSKDDNQEENSSQDYTENSDNTAYTEISSEDREDSDSRNSNEKVKKVLGSKFNIDVPDDAKFSGPYLKELRESAGADLRDMSKVSKVSYTNLGLLEDEVWNQLPALVYLRGYIAQYAKYLGLDAKRVTEDLVDRFNEWKIGSEE